MGVAVSSVLDETLRVEINELKESIKKELPYAKILGDEFPIKVILKRGTYTINEFGKIEEFVGISLDSDNITLQLIDGVGESQKITAILTNLEGTISWNVSNPEIVTVDNTGNITAVGEGTAKIEATCKGKTAECNVTVKSVVSISSITLKIGTVEVTDSTGIQEIYKGETLQIEAITNNNATEVVQWESSNLELATVEASGDRNLIATVKGINPSSEEITITAKGTKGVSKSVKVKIIAPIEYGAKDITKDLMKTSVVVNYNGRKWYVYYADNTNIYLILKGTTTNPTDNTKTVNPPLTGSLKNNYNNGIAMVSNINTNAQTSSRFPAVKEGWIKKWINSGLTMNGYGAKVALYMLDSDVWNSYKGDLGEWAIRESVVGDDSCVL